MKIIPATMITIEALMDHSLTVKFPPEPSTFEGSLKTLEEIIARLGDPELPLEEALTLFEAGIKHLRHCEDLLKKGERKVQLLLEDGNTEPFPEPG